MFKEIRMGAGTERASKVSNASGVRSLVADSAE